ncbi:hypothetical protein [Nocardia sp. NBC_00403]|uniref:hypothetical protein n=1 Tax=Nocardia sp. NBC_00403 TaxID=2975990 RepID=UPI002E234ED6
MLDESDVGQARVFYDLLNNEAAALATTVQALTIRRGEFRSTAEAQLYRRELNEVCRCLDQLRNRFPQLDFSAD